jgi:hypothetical protein
MTEHDPEPQPGDGPEYHADHAYWLARQLDWRLEAMKIHIPYLDAD